MNALTRLAAHVRRRSPRHAWPRSARAARVFRSTRHEPRFALVALDL